MYRAECSSLRDFGRVIAFFIRGWTAYSEAVYISDSEDFVCMTKADVGQMLFGDGSIRVVAASVAPSRGVKIEVCSRFEPYAFVFQVYTVITSTKTCAFYSTSQADLFNT